MPETANLDHLRQQLVNALPHPDPAHWSELIDPVLEWLNQHWATLREQPVNGCATRAKLEALLREPPPEDGQSFRDVFSEFRDKIAPYSCRINHPRFLGFVPGAPSILSVIGELLTAGTNFFAGVWVEGASAAMVELLVLDWFKELLGYPSTAEGILTAGGSEANLTALAAARDVLLSYEDRAVAVAYVSEQRHRSIDRAAMVIGLRPDQVHVVPADDRFRCQPTLLEKAIVADRAAGRRPWLVVANAGATNTGAVDPLRELVTLCRSEGLWLHVDAAYGWAGALAESERLRFDGLDEVDSITLDPHKWFGQTFDVGCLLVRDTGRLTNTFAVRPDYLQDVEPTGGAVNFADRGLALTRRFRALKIWLSVKVLGIGWFRKLAERSCLLGELAERLLRQTPHFEILCPRQLSIVCYRYRPPGLTETRVDQLNLDLVEAVRQSDKAFVSSTRLRGRVALRFCFVNWQTTATDVEAVIELLRSFGEHLLRRQDRE